LADQPDALLLHILVSTNNQLISNAIVINWPSKPTGLLLTPLFLNMLSRAVRPAVRAGAGAAASTRYERLLTGKEEFKREPGSYREAWEKDGEDSNRKIMNAY